MGFRYYQRRDCPICNGARSDCRQNTTTGIVHCRDGSANPIGWHLIREDAQGFLMWGEGDGQDAISSEERQRRQQEQKIERQRREEEKRRGALPVEERDTAIRQLHKHFGLAHRHREDLQRRGLTEEQIEKLLFFSVQPGERVPMGIPENLPGIKNGRFFGKDGYACSTFNPQGQIKGYQIRLDNPEDGKYRWASGSKSSHLPNGELPITFVRPLNGVIKRKAIGICEGILKPQITANKRGQIVIGASGFQFSKDGEGDDGKPERKPLEQLEQYLAAASSELGGTKDVELYPDGGVVANPQIYQKYQWLWNALKKLGYKVKIVWWGQIDKDQPDCDELPEDIEIKLISPGKFADLAKRFGGADTPWQQKVRREWKKNRTFTPDIVTCDKFVTWGLPADDTIFFGRAGLGAGKTTRLKAWVEQWKAEGQRRFYVLGYRNTLLLQAASQLGFMHIHDRDAALFRADEDTSFCLCVDSLLKIRPEDFEDSVLLLDEIMSVIRHLMHSPTIPRHKKNKILQLFENAIQSAKVVICMDGLMADWAVDYLAEIAPEKKILKIQNTYKAKKPVINFLTGTEDFDEKIKPNDRSPWVNQMLESPRPVICSDSQVFCEGMEELILSRFPEVKILRIDSKTIPEEYAKEFLADCNEYIQKYEIDVLIYSPSAESGLDVSIPDWFTDQFGFFFGVLGVDAIIQMLGRIRDPQVERFLWCREWVAGDEREHSKSPFVEEIEKNIGWVIQEEITQSVKNFGIGGTLPEFLAWIGQTACGTIERSVDVHFRASCLIKSIENAENANLRSFLREALRNEGYGIRELILPPFFEEKELEKEAKEAVKRQNAADIFNAPVEDEQIEELAKQVLAFDSTWEDRCRRMKAVLLDRLPGFKNSEAWSPDFIYLTKYQEPEFISRQELFWLLKHPEEAEKEGIRRLHWFARCEKTFIGCFKSRPLKIQALKELEIERFFDLDATWCDSSPEIQDLLERCKKPAIAKILGHPGKSSGIKNLNRLLKLLGIFLRMSERSREERKIFRFYKIDSEAFFDPARLAVLKALGSRYEKAKLEEKPLDWNDIFQGKTFSDETPTQKNLAAAETTQTCDTYPQNIYIYTGVCVTPTSDESLKESEPEAELDEACDNTKNSPENSSDFSGEEVIGEVEKFEILSVSGKSIVIPRRVMAAVSTGSNPPPLTPLEILIEKLAACETPEEFQLAIQGQPPERVEDAIVCQDTQPMRSRLRRWLEQDEKICGQDSQRKNRPRWSLALTPSLRL